MNTLPNDALPTFETVRLSITGGIARLTLNRPDALNALSAPMFHDIPAAVDAAGLAGARVLLITGAGRAFCAGADLQQRKMNTDPLEWRRELANRQLFERAIRVITVINEAPMPVVGAINGVAAGGGVGIALGCDVVLMARSARLVLPFVPKLGVVPDIALTWSMTRSVGRAKALPSMLLGDPIGSDEAERMGLVYKVIDDERFEDETLAFCTRLANSPQPAIRGTRKLVDMATALTLRDHIALERDFQAKLTGGADFIEGVAAFREKREPRFENN